ncbi:hypothetical protein [Dermatophilus congolensis]|uniref:hypothetical protein n=1 Tax=Dermatophilus congolensis TaxID=1863 RepID=UPI001FB90721|nr:hypothetical protein [Dermatophilus congolensis]
MTGGTHMGRHVFRGYIAGVGTQEGTRLVVGRWVDSPLGTFTDVMVERANGWRILLAPSAEVADFVTATYTFDEVITVPVSCEVTTVSPGIDHWGLKAGPLELSLTTGERTPLGWLLHLIPTYIATSPAFCRLTDVPARLVGLRTAGTAGHGRREFYGACDVHAITDSIASWQGQDLGSLQRVAPPVRFGFGSTPPRPAVTSVTTTIIDAN